MNIISDWDIRFTRQLWIALFNMIGIDVKFLIANHLQTDGKTERVNHLLEKYLRHYMSTSQRNWLELLDSAQYCCNLHKSSIIENSTFKLVLRLLTYDPFSHSQTSDEWQMSCNLSFCKEQIKDV